MPHGMQCLRPSLVQGQGSYMILRSLNVFCSHDTTTGVVAWCFWMSCPTILSSCLICCESCDSLVPNRLSPSPSRLTWHWHCCHAHLLRHCMLLGSFLGKQVAEVSA